MPLASSGAWLSLGREAFASMRNLPSSRTYHIYARNPQPTSTAQRLLHQTRNLVHAFVGHLTTPGTLGHQTPAHTLYHLARGRTIENGLSLHVRHALSQPLGAPKLPRPPIVPRTVFQVGLGTVRKFSTARPIFAHLVENVPVAGRALVEADWDLRMHEEKIRFMKQAAEQQGETQERIKAEKIAIYANAQTDAPVESEPEQELEHYFSSPVTPETILGATATLLIPLAPTPSSRLPLPAMPKGDVSSNPIVPFAELSALHYDFVQHNSRVAALFDRLDSAKVWDKGARCDAYGDVQGGANILRVAFDGWDAKRVRAVIGETASGWCILEEDRELNEEELDETLDALDRADRPLSPLSPLSHHSRSSSPLSSLGDLGVSFDLSQSFILPTLDFSSTFKASIHSVNDTDRSVDYFSETESRSDASWTELPSAADTSSTSSHLEFSSLFEARMQETLM